MSDNLDYVLVKLVKALTELTKRVTDILTNGIDVGPHRVTPVKPKAEK